MITNDDKYTKQQEAFIREMFPALPINYLGSKLFNQMCIALNKPLRAVMTKMHRMGLRKFDRYVPDPPKEKSKRPPTVYTNIRSPYGIADHLHCGNRIFV